MSGANSTVNQKVLIGAQSATDTPVTPTRQFSNTTVNFTEELETNSYRPAGSKVNKTIVVNDITGKGDYSGVLSFIESLYFFESYVGSGGSGPDTLAGGGKKWLYMPALGDIDPYVLFTLQRGSLQRGHQTNDALFNSIVINLSRKGAQVSGEILAKGVTPGVTMNLARNEVQQIAKTGTPTAGTFTITYSGQTTTAIAYNASAATIKAALEALSNIAVGDVTVTGGPLPNTAIVVKFRGALAAQNLTQMTFDSTSVTGGTFAVSTTTQGSAGATELDSAPVSGSQINIYLDEAYNDIGTTEIEDNFTAQITLPPKYIPKRVMGRSHASWKEPGEQAMEPTCVITMEANTYSDALYATAKENGVDGVPTQYVRVDAIGAEIPGATDHFEWVFDMPLKLKGAVPNGDTDGIDSYVFTFELVEDDDMGSWFETYFVNNLASLN
ncbi:MAG TPA: hypothetical protein VF735_03265 [Pyrinomonadaceae bacterium]|jgi:hypothetical protein